MEQRQNVDNKVALFDFCETLVRFQSADKYVRFALAHMKPTFKSRFYGWLRSFLIRTKLMPAVERRAGNMSMNKLLLIKQLSGAKETTMKSLAEQFYQQKIKPAYIAESLERMEELLREGYRIIIVSGGFDVYLDCFCAEYGIEAPVCTNLCYRNGKFTGTYSGPDCMGSTKLSILSGRLDLEELKTCDSIAFSDSLGDLPLLTACKQGVVVAKEAPNWAKENGFKVLLWED